MLREKQTMRWGRSILSVLMVSLILCSLLCAYALRSLENNVMENNAAITSYVQRSMDSELEKFYHYSNLVGINRENMLLKKLTAHPEPLPQEAYRLSESLRHYLATSTMVSDVYVCYPRAELVVGARGCFRPESYFALQQMPSRAGVQQWMEQMMEKRDTGFLLMKLPQDDRLCYVCPMKMQGKTVAVMVLEVDREQMLADFEPTGLPQQASVAVLLEGELVAFTGNEELVEQLPGLYDSWQQTGSDNVRVHGTFAFFHSSTLSGIEYVNVCSSGALLKNVRLTLTMCMLGAVFCLVFDVLASITISSRNSRPLKKLLAQVGAVPSPDQDEYELITDRFRQLLSEKNKNQQLVQRQQSLLDGMFLSTVLRGGLYSENAVFAAAKRYEVSFDCPCYQVMVLSGSGRSITGDAPELEVITRELQAMGCDALAAAYRGRYVVLLNTEECLGQERSGEIARLLLYRIFGTQKAHAGIGPCYDNMLDILTSYNCALQALKQLRPEHSHPVSHYAPGMVRTDQGDPAVMQAFSHHVYTREFGQAQRLLERLYTEYLYAGGSGPLEQMRQNAVDSLLADALRQVLPAERAQEEVGKLLSCDAPDAQRCQTERVLQVLMDAVTAEPQEKPSVAVRAKRIIDENFADPMMGLYMVSEQLSVSNSYLSTTFKNTYGISIISYINRLRVDRAKSLILNTDHSIKEIALEVGFSSDINFIRVFKKLENLTPTTLRKENTAAGKSAK